MRVSDISLDKLDKCRFHDSNGNCIPFDMAVNKLSWWEIYSAPNLADVKIIAPKSACTGFMNDVIGMLKGKTLATLQEIAASLGINEALCQSWLWSCAHYGMTQREFPFGATECFWVIE